MDTVLVAATVAAALRQATAYSDYKAHRRPLYHIIRAISVLGST